MGNMPFWYNVMKNQKLEDKRLYDVIHERQTQIDLLIIDGIYSQTNINNIDKLRSLMATFDDLPIYVIISGGFGPEVFDTKVFYSYNKFIHFRDIPRKLFQKFNERRIENMNTKEYSTEALKTFSKDLTLNIDNKRWRY